MRFTLTLADGAGVGAREVGAECPNRPLERVLLNVPYFVASLCEWANGDNPADVCGEEVGNNRDVADTGTGAAIDTSSSSIWAGV